MKTIEDIIHVIQNRPGCMRVTRINSKCEAWNNLVGDIRASWKAFLLSVFAGTFALLFGYSMVGFSAGKTQSTKPKIKRPMKSSTAHATGTISMPVWSPAGNRIAFVYSKHDDSEIFIVNADGTNPVNASNSPGTDEFPVWSPDGGKLAFVSKRNGSFDICIVDNQGQNLNCITAEKKRQDNRLWDDLYPAWSPDGKTIAYCSFRAGYKQVWFIDADGSNPHVFYEKESCYPNFSSDGRKIAFASGGDLTVYDLSKNTVKDITAGLIGGDMIDDTIPVWAPKGDRIAFVGQFEAFQSEIYTISSSGKTVRRITDNLFEDFMPRWKPDGKGIIYAAYVLSRPPEIFISDPMSPDKKRLTDNFDMDFSPSFSPDGKKVAFLRRIDGKDNLFVMDTVGVKRKDGTYDHMETLIVAVSDHLDPAFNPDLPRPKKQAK